MNEYRYNSLKLGMMENFNIVITENIMNRFLEITGDNNPLHINSNHAKYYNFKEKVVYGMLTASFYSTLVGVYLPGKYSILHDINIKFNKPVFIGDNLNIHGSVTFMSDSVKVVEIKAYITNQEEYKVSSAKIRAGLLE